MEHYRDQQSVEIRSIHICILFAAFDGSKHRKSHGSCDAGSRLISHADHSSDLTTTPQVYWDVALRIYLIGIVVRVAHLVNARAGERAAAQVLSQTRAPRPREAAVAAVLTLIRRLLAVAAAAPDLKGRKEGELNSMWLDWFWLDAALSSSSPNSMQS